MNLVDHGQQGSRIRNVSVLAAASLPEAIVDLAVGLWIAQLIEKGGRLSAKKSQCPPLDRDIAGRPNETHFINGLPRPNDNVHMFRHHDLRPQEKIRFPAAAIKGVQKPVSGPIPAQKRQAAETGKGQLVGMPRDVIASAAFAMGVLHSSRVRPTSMLSRPMLS
jgi:hypothetical protein